MDDLKLSVAKSIDIQNQRFEADAIKYSKEINQILESDKADLNGQRMLLGRVFIAAVKQEMGVGLVRAGIFGSVSRNASKETSDVDIALFIQKLTAEEHKIHNSFDLQRERGYGAYYVLNGANNQHRIDELERVFSEKIGIPVRSMKYYDNEEDFADIKKEINFITVLE